MLAYLICGVFGFVFSDLIPGSASLGESIDEMLPNMANGDGLLDQVSGGLKSRRIANGLAGASILMGTLFIYRRVK